MMSWLTPQEVNEDLLECLWEESLPRTWYISRDAYGLCQSLLAKLYQYAAIFSSSNTNQSLLTNTEFTPKEEKGVFRRQKLLDKGAPRLKVPHNATEGRSQDLKLSSLWIEPHDLTFILPLSSSLV